MLDDEIVEGLYNGVPRGGWKGARTISFQAPKRHGVYMVWQYGDLQYTMADAIKNLKQRSCESPLRDFVAWVEVKDVPQKPWKITSFMKSAYDYIQSKWKRS